MSYREQILHRLTFLRAELDVLTALVKSAEAASEIDPAYTPAMPAPEPPPAEKKRKKAPPRWSYVPTAVYRLVGNNPFRTGNSYDLFEHLKGRFGDAPFTRETMGAIFEALRSEGTLTTIQSERQFIISFVQFAGNKGSLVMGDEEEAPVEADLPPEPEPEPEPEPTKAATKTRKKA